MNFISHFYADLHTTDSHFVIGTVTPDLLSIYNPGLRIKNAHVAKFQKSGKDSGAPSFVKGLMRHFFVDRVFHSSAHFTLETKRISDLLVARFPGQDIPRKFFIAHILLELLLDKILIVQKPGILDAFYAHFASQGDFAEIHRATELISGNTLTNYASFLHKFLENRYLAHYQEYDHITYVLGRILRRVKVVEQDFLETPAFYKLMEDTEAHLAGMHEIFYEEIRTTLE